jgi:hypothetical protein
MSGWLKAGLIGAGILVAISVVGVIPCIGCCALPLEWVAFGCIGALAAYWIPPTRAMGTAAAHGALAALIAAAIGGVVGIGVDLVGEAVLGPAQLAWLNQLPPDVLRGLYEAGIDPRMLAGEGVGAFTSVMGSSVCCGISLGIGAALGAVGGLVFAAIKQE